MQFHKGNNKKKYIYYNRGGDGYQLYGRVTGEYNIISHWEWDRDYRKQQICKNNKLAAVRFTFVFFFLGRFLLSRRK